MPQLTDMAAEASKANYAYETLRSRIVMLDIAPGTAINEAALTAELGVGRTPIREALKRLERDHLVAFYPRRGTFATSVDITDLAKISEMRALLEPLAARRAALRLPRSLRPRFEAAITEIETLAPGLDQRQLLELDLEIHRLIYRAAENRHLEDTLVRLNDLATRIWRIVEDHLPSIAQHVQEHTQLLRAILDAEPDIAAELAAAHVQGFEATVRAAL